MAGGRCSISYMRRLALCLLFATLLNPAPALAKGVIARLDVFPSPTRVAARTTIQIRPYQLRSGLPPGLLPTNYRWHVLAYPPRGAPTKLRFARSERDPYVWTATVRFRTRGDWLLSLQQGEEPQSQDVNVLRGAPTVWERLQRPFLAPTVAADAPCPIATANPGGDLTRFGVTGTAWGVGPVFPLGLQNDRPLLLYENQATSSSGWGDWPGREMSWLRDPTYAGPILIRGLPLDGYGEVRFGSGFIPNRSLRLTGRLRRAPTRLQGDRCYAFQVDGIGFSYAIGFEAEATSP
jgi:hypothetical protein